MSIFHSVMPTTPPSNPRFPEELLRAIARPGGGGVVLVVGAGCSVEPPTSLPLASECAEEAHHQLVNDRVLAEGDCTRPNDLSLLADVVFAKSGSQVELVRRLPRGRFQQAEPNEGYLVAAALLLEGAVTSLLTLNFDLAMVAALVQVGSQGRVAVVNGPDAFGEIGTLNVIYLHRDANAAADEWILRSAALAVEWHGEWQEAMANRVLTSPVIVFAGLGAPAAVLVDTISRIRGILGSTVQVFQVDPTPRDRSAFFASLSIPETSYLQLGWCAFMDALGRRLLEEHRRELEQACNVLTAQERWPAEDIPPLLERLVLLGLVGLGRFRARCLLRVESYLPRRDAPAELLADLLLGVALIERHAAVRAVFGEDAVVEFHRGDRLVGLAILASGRGVRRWLSLEAEISNYTPSRRVRVRQPQVTIVAGVVGSRPLQVAAPRSVVGEQPDNIVSSLGDINMISVDEIRADADRIHREVLR